MAFQDGEQVGAYRIIEQLGRGGMATVYKAYHANLDRYVALKVLHPAFMQDPNFLARFEREAKVVAKLEHPNIIPVYDFAEHEISPYLVMKYVEGETLKARITRDTLSPEEGVKIIEDVGKGLAYAHQQGILHRDIKPSNVILDNDGQVYLADFGLARIATAGESTMSGDMMLGTPQYISPEQAMGKRELDAGTDIYSFGVMIYEIVVGQVPYLSDTPFSIVHDHIYKPLPLPRATNPNVPESVERVLLKALAKEREDRFETVDDLVAAFKRAVQGEPMPDEWAATEMVGGQSTIQIDSTTQAAQPGTPPPTPVPTQVYEEPPLAPKKKRFTWKRVLLGLVGIVVLCVCSVLVIDVLSEKNNQNDLSANANLNEKTNSAGQDALGEELEREYIIEQAAMAVEEDPENPVLQLELAITLYDAGRDDEANEVFLMAQVLAEEDPEFYILAGDMLEARELWLFALQQYAQAVEFGHDAETAGFSAKVMKTLYYASADSSIQGLLFDELREDDATISVPVLLASRARYTLLVEGSAARAEEILARVSARDRLQTPYTNLVYAEILISMEAYETAAELLDEISQTEGNSIDWIRVEARRLTSQLP